MHLLYRSKQLLEDQMEAGVLWPGAVVSVKVFKTLVNFTYTLVFQVWPGVRTEWVKADRFVQGGFP